MNRTAENDSSNHRKYFPLLNIIHIVWMEHLVETVELIWESDDRRAGIKNDGNGLYHEFSITHTGIWMT